MFFVLQNGMAQSTQCIIGASVMKDISDIFTKRPIPLYN